MNKSGLNESIITEHPLLDSSVSKFDVKSSIYKQKSIFSNENLASLNIEQLKSYEGMTGVIGNEDDLVNEINEGAGIQLLEALVICHRAKVNLAHTSIGVTDMDYMYESKRKDEETILEFTSCFGGYFEKFDIVDNPSECHVEFKKNKIQYKVLGRRKFMIYYVVFYSFFFVFFIDFWSFKFLCLFCFLLFI